MLIQKTTPAQPKPIVLTNEQAGRRLRMRIEQMYSNLKREHDSAMSFLWNQPEPIEIIKAEFGTDAKALFDISRGIQDLLKLANADYVIKPAPVEIEFNEDGSVKDEETNPETNDTP